MMTAIRVLIVDDHPMVRRGLRSLLSAYRDLTVVGEAGDGVTAIQAAQTLSPDVILLDIRLPGPDGVEIARQLRRQAPGAKVIILTAFDNDEYVWGTLQAGVHAYLLKNTSDETVVETIRQVYQDKRLLTPSLMDKVLQQFETLARAHVRHEFDLCQEDLEVLELLAHGANTKDIGDKVYCSERTVKRRIEEIATKLGAKNRAEAVAQAIKSGLI